MSTGNEVTIVVTGKDHTGPAAASAQANMRKVTTEAHALGTSVETTGRRAGVMSGFFGSLSERLMRMTSGWIDLRVAAGLAAVGMDALAPAIAAVGGAAAAAVTGIFGLVAGISVLWMGLGGLGDAWQAANQQATGGVGASKAAAQAQREVKRSTDALADAHRAATAAERALIAAREDESDRLEDLSRNLASARLDEEGAILAVQRAEVRLREVRREKGHTALDVREAELAYRQAKQTVADMKDRVSDLGKEQADGARKGVEGSDAVQSALERQAQAQRQVLEATERLADAQTSLSDGVGGVDKFAEAMGKLSRNAQALVLTLLALRAPFGALRDSVQDRLLAGFDTSVRELAEKWLPALHPMLGGLADRFNVVGKQMMTALGDPTFIKNTQTAVSGFGDFIARLGEATAPLIDAFGRIAAAGAPVLKEIGELVGGAAEKFAGWIKKADESGAMAKFMQDSVKALRDIWSLGGSVLGLFGDLVKLSGAGPSVTFTGLRAGIEGIRDLLGSPQIKTAADFIRNTVTPAMREFGEYISTNLLPIAKEFWEKHVTRMSEALDKIKKAFSDNREQIGQFTDVLKVVAAFIVEKVIPVLLDLYSKYLSGLIGAIGNVIRWISLMVDFWNWLWRTVSDVAAGIIGGFGKVVDFVTGLPGRIASATVGMWNGIKDSFRDAVNWIIDRWNNLQFTVGGGNVFGQDIPSFTLDTPNIPRFAHGGIGGGLAMVGERGRELVQLPQGSRVIPNGTTEQMLGASGGGRMELVVSAAAGMARDLTAAVVKSLRYEIRTTAGGSAESFFARSA